MIAYLQGINGRVTWNKLILGLKTTIIIYYNSHYNSFVVVPFLLAQVKIDGGSNPLIFVLSRSTVVIIISKVKFSHTKVSVRGISWITRFFSAATFFWCKWFASELEIDPFPENCLHATNSVWIRQVCLLPLSTDTHSRKALLVLSRPGSVLPCSTRCY